MGVVWHGHYPLYFEDAREAFGKEYGLEYQTIYGNGWFAPIVELNLKYHKSLHHGQKATVDIIYRPKPSAKIVFDYEIRDEAGELCVEGHSVQVFTTKDGELSWDNPEFYAKWKERWGQTEDKNDI
jgi:acyl-CoA thioester hydrolase